MNSHTQTPAVENPKVVCLIIDAASFPLVERFLRDGKLPRLASVAREGAWGPLTVNEFNCQTPAALASILTGRPSENNHIGGFHTPCRHPGRPLTTYRSSFRDCRIDDPLLWQWAAANGKTATLAHVPYSRSQDYISRHIRFSVNGYDYRLCRGEVIRLPGLESKPEIHLQAGILLGGYAIHIDGWRRSKDDPAFSRVRLTAKQSKNWVEMVPCQNGPLQYSDLQLDEQTSTAVYLFNLPGSRDSILYVTGVYRLSPVPGGEADGFYRSTGAFQGEGCGRYYRAGSFGTPLYHGGDGAAERLFLQLLGGVTDYFQRVYERCLREYPADLTVFYLPTIDEASHEWLGFVDEECRMYDPSGRYEELLASAYRDCDRAVGGILDRVSSDTPVVVLSDHGMVGCRRNVYLNTLLESEGFLTFTAEGDIDLAATEVFYHPAENGAICINSDEFTQGIVPASRVKTLKVEIQRLLEHYRDPQTDEPIAARVDDMDAQTVKNSYVYGDLFFIPGSGYSVKALASPTGRVSEETFKSGTHHFNTGRSMMNGIYFIANGPGALKGKRQTLKNLDILPLICTLLRIPAPGGIPESSALLQLFSKPKEPS